MTAVSVVLACLFDHWLGEPTRCHPLVKFGRWADILEIRLNVVTHIGSFYQVGFGTIAVIVLLAPCILVGYLLSGIPILGPILACLGLYLVIGRRSLIEHAQSVNDALQNQNIMLARKNLSRMVSRETKHADPQRISVGVIESVLENGNDAIFAAIFWFIVAGLPGIALYRLSNTLDAMWGYKTERYIFFGRFAARLDDLLNWIPSRLTALGYSLAGQTKYAVQCWRNQAGNWESPNAGPVISSGAGALSVQLGGPARYHGKLVDRPTLGCGNPPVIDDIDRSIDLLTRSLLIWLGIIIIGDWLID